MYGGFSGSQGMIIYNTKKSGDNGVYGYYEHDEIVLVQGEYRALREQQKTREEAYKREDDPLLKYVVLLFLLDCIAIVLAFVFEPFRIGAAVTVFAIGSFFPVLIIGYARMMDYRTMELHEQFRRFHGCEHQTVSWLTKHEKGERSTMETLMEQPFYDSECGTAYAGYLLTVSLVLAVVIANITTLGLLRALGILLGLVALLVINIFNPYNPYLLLQKSVVARPEEREYVLALAIAERLIGSETGLQRDEPKEKV